MAVVGVEGKSTTSSEVARTVFGMVRTPAHSPTPAGRGSNAQGGPQQTQGLAAQALEEARARAVGARLAAEQALRVAEDLEGIVRELENFTTTTEPIGTPRRTASTEYPPNPAADLNRWWFAREYPNLEDGIWTAAALEGAGVNPAVPQAKGLLAGSKGCDPALRKAKETGVQTTIVHWY